MREFFKENPKVRIILIIASFVMALFFVIIGWKQTGEMTGLIKMILGVAFLLAALKLYNITFEDKKMK